MFWNFRPLSTHIQLCRLWDRALSLRVTGNPFPALFPNLSTQNSAWGRIGGGGGRCTSLTTSTLCAFLSLFRTREAGEPGVTEGQRGPGTFPPGEGTSLENWQAFKRDNGDWPVCAHELWSSVLCPKPRRNVGPRWVQRPSCLGP